MIISVLIAIIVAASLVVIMMVAAKGSKKEKNKDVADRVKKKGKAAILKEAQKKLAHDPHNILALETVGDLYYQEKNWDKVYNVYNTLYGLSAAHLEINVAKVTRRMGIAAYNLEKYDDALNALMVSCKKESESFETNIFLAKAFIKKEIYDKAIICLKKCKLLQPDSSDVNLNLANCLFKAQKYRDALPFIKRVLDEQPENKEMLFNMAVAMSECNMAEKALKVFIHLRPDPQFGAQSCLEAGKMHERSKNFQQAIQDYQIAFKLQNVPEQTMTQIRYRCANVFIAQNDISKGLELLKQIQSSHPGYKDVDALVSRYAELNQNKNLQVYLLSGTSDFVALSRKLIQFIFKDSFVKVEDVAVQSESVEIICFVQSNKWEAKQLFRFYRTTSVIGDIYVREFHSKMRDTKCDNGYCITMGFFSEGAHKYTEGRPVDLIEKDQLTTILKKINMMG